MDLDEGCAFGFHLEGALDAGYPVGVGDPAVIGAGFACAQVGGDDGFAFEAFGRDARHCALLDDGAESIGGICGGLLGFLFVGDLDQHFDQATVASFGDLVGEGMDDYFPAADDGFVELGVIHVTGEAGIVPDEECGGAVDGGFVICDHAQEVVTTGGGGA